MRRFRMIWALVTIFSVLTVGAHAWQAPDGLPEAIRNAVRRPEQLPKGTYVPVKIWSAVSGDASHQTGHHAADPEALQSEAWEVKAGQDNAMGGAMIYGPYLNLPPGDYVAFFRMKLLEEAGEDEVATVDATTENGQNTLQARYLVGSDLSVNRYVEVPLPFHLTGNRLECRVLWQGYSDLRVDQIALFRLEGGRIDNSAGRAPQPTPSGNPHDLMPQSESRPFPEIFPRSKAPAEHLVVCDLRRQPPDWQYLAMSLEGIVNRSRPEIYCLTNDQDSFWLNRMVERKWVKTTERVTHPAALLKRFGVRVKGMIVTDPALPTSRNMATMLAGVKDGIVVSPRLAKTLTLPVLEDLRGRWKTSVEATQWAFDHLWPELNHHVIACSYPDQIALRDYLVENRVFIFWLSGPIDGARPYANPQAELEQMERLLAKMPVNIPVMSYPYAGKDVGIGEGPGVTLFAEFGKYLVGTTDTSNLSVHSGIPITRLKQKTPPPAPKLDRSKVYVTWLMSDGDNLPVLTTYNFPQLWRDPQRGQFPITWTASPSAIMLIPDVMDYYYSTATPGDEWVGAVSGVGYTYPDSYGIRFRGQERQRVYEGFLGQTATYMARMDEHILWPMNVMKPELIAEYADRLPGLEAIFPDYGRRIADYESAVYPTDHNVPVFHAITSWQEGQTREQQIESTVAQIKAMTPHTRPAFLHLFIWNWGAQLPILREVLQQLGPEYSAVRADHLAALYRQYMAQEQVLVRTPSSLVGLGGHPLIFSVELRNVTNKRMEVKAGVSGGLEAKNTPSTMTLAAEQAATMRLTGKPTGHPVTLDITGPFGQRKRTIPTREISAAELSVDLPTNVTLRFVGQFAATDLSHRSGRSETDPQAMLGNVWAVRKGATEPGYVLFGPYVPTVKGRYLAVFRLKRIGEGSGDIVTLDTCVGGGMPVTSTNTLTDHDLPLNVYRSVGLVFDHPGGALEMRANWPGSADIAIDSISLFAVESP